MSEQLPATVSATARRAQILALLAQGEQAVDKLAARFGVSGMTIRRDLQELADAGRVIRTHGGAASSDRISFEFRFLERAELQRAEKEAIAATAAGLVRPAQSVLLDSGTTTLAIARRLRSIANLTVITSSLPIASELFGVESVSTLLLGGQLRHGSPDLFGAITQQNLESLRADIAFIGADAIDEKGNLYNASADIGRLLSRMALSAERVYAVADHSKIGKHELMRFARLHEWAGLITDAGLPRKLRRSLEKSGANVIVAGEDTPQAPS